MSSTGAAATIVNPGWARRLVRAAIAGPEYGPDARDLATISVAGLRLPLRATIALLAVVLLLLADFDRIFLPNTAFIPPRGPESLRVVGLERVVLFGIVPVLLVLLALRDRPGRYGLAIGDWRAGLPLLAAGCALMTPIVLVVASLPIFREYYAQTATDLPNLVLSYSLDSFPAEFFFRGFLMFALLRSIGPTAVIVAALPFAFAHLGKPDLELLSTVFGGMVYGWLNWRTGSILYSAIGHVYVLTIATVVAAAA